MITSTTTNRLFETLGYEKGIEAAAKAGFDALDLNLCLLMDNSEMSEENYAGTAAMLKDTAEKNGIYFNQAHAPYPAYIEGDEEYNTKIFPQLVRAIRIAGIIGASQIIVHPTEIYKEPEQMKFNVDFYKRLIPYCKEAGVKIGIENMWGWADNYTRIVPNVCSTGRELAMYYDELDPEYFTVCLDIGHTVLTGQQPQEAIIEIGPRLGALHIHDNNGIDDLHDIPYRGILDWEKITKALSEVKYSGDFTYEVNIANTEFGGYAENPELMHKALRCLVETAHKLIDMIG